MMDSIGAGVIAVDTRTHVIEQVYTTAARIIGMPPGQIVGRSCHRFLCPAEAGPCPITDLGQEVDNTDCVILPGGWPTPARHEVLAS